MLLTELLFVLFSRKGHLMGFKMRHVGKLQNVLSKIALLKVQANNLVKGT